MLLLGQVLEASDFAEAIVGTTRAVELVCHVLLSGAEVDSDLITNSDVLQSDTNENGPIGVKSSICLQVSVWLRLREGSAE